MPDLTMADILVINPNSSQAVTRAIDTALEPLRRHSPFPIRVIGLDGTPAGIAMQSDADMVAPRVQEAILRERALGYVVACFSDPGVAGARELHPGAPVRGIGEGAILHAMGCGDRFGIIALSERSVLRQRRLVRIMGVGERYAGSRPIGASAADTTGEGVRDRMCEAARRLVADGADVVVLGCAGMAHLKEAIEAACGRPVVEPSIVTTALVIGDCLLRA